MVDRFPKLPALPKSNFGLSNDWKVAYYRNLRSTWNCWWRHFRSGYESYADYQLVFFEFASSSNFRENRKQRNLRRRLQLRRTTTIALIANASLFSLKSKKSKTFPFIFDRTICPWSCRLSIFYLFHCSRVMNPRQLDNIINVRARVGLDSQRLGKIICSSLLPARRELQTTIILI